MRPRHSDLILRAPVLAIMIFQIAALFIRSSVQLNLEERGFDAEDARNLSFLLVPLVELLLLWPILKQNRAALQKLFARPRSWMRTMLTAIALGAALRICYWSGIISNSAFGWLGFTQGGRGGAAMVWFDCPPIPNLLLALVVMAVMTPLLEELVNRGLILGALLGKTNTAAAIVISAGLFAVLHSPQSIPVAFAIGVILSVQTIRSGSLLPSIASHATYNFLSVIDWQCLHGIWNPTHLTQDGKAVGTIALVTGVFALLGVIRLLVCTSTGAHETPRQQSNVT